jgi:molybdopterin synthase catalytic subunit
LPRCAKLWARAARSTGSPPAGPPPRSQTKEEDISGLTLAHYPGMTERAIEAMIVEAEKRFAVQGALVIHRVGRLRQGERIVLVATMSPNRRDAFQACEFLMDYLKTHAPFWKKEMTGQGERWVDARVEDDAALQRWGLESADAARRQGEGTAGG